MNYQDDIEMTLEDFKIEVAANCLDAKYDDIEELFFDGYNVQDAIEFLKFQDEEYPV